MIYFQNRWHGTVIALSALTVVALGVAYALYQESENQAERQRYLDATSLCSFYDQTAVCMTGIHSRGMNFILNARLFCWDTTCKMKEDLGIGLYQIACRVEGSFSDLSDTACCLWDMARKAGLRIAGESKNKDNIEALANKIFS